MRAIFKLPAIQAERKRNWYLYMLVCSLTVVLLFAVAVSSFAAEDGEQSGEQSANILRNSGFEDGLTGWTPWIPRGQPEVTVDTTVSHSGQASLRITGYQNTDRGSVNQIAEPVAGKTYLFRVWIKTENVKPNNAMLRIQFNLVKGGEKTRPHLYLGRIGGTQDWTLFEEVTLVPEGTTSLTVEPFLDSARGIMWIDDIEIVPVEDSVGDKEMSTTQSTSAAGTPAAEAVSSAVSAASGAAAEAGAEVIIPRLPEEAVAQEHPFLFISAAEIEALNKQAETDAGLKIMIDNDIIIPGKMAVINAAKGITLPAKGKNSAHAELARQARRAALGYAFSGDESMAKTAKEYLLAYARSYKSYPLEIAYDGRVTTQTLNESPWLIDLAWTYDLIWNSGVLSAAEREEIEKNLLWEAVRVIDRYDKKLSNWQAWHNAAIGAVAFLFNDERWIKEILTGPQSFTTHIREAVMADGMWWEQSIGYHNYTLQAMTFLAEMAYRRGYDLYHYTSNGKSLKLMYDAAIYHAFSNGHQSVIGNAGYNSSLSFTWFYGLAAKRYGDPLYAALWRKQPAGGSGAPIPLVFYINEMKSLVDQSTLTTHPGYFAPAGYNTAGHTLLADTGMVVMRGRSGTTPGPEVSLIYKPHGTSIGHQAADNLTIIMEGKGGKWLPGPGSYDYDSSEQGTWYKQTIARNGVVVDGISQDPQGISSGIYVTDGWGASSSGSLVHFAGLSGAALTTAKTNRVYQGVEMDRTVVVSAPYIIDRYKVASTRERQYDWVAHIDALEKEFSLPEKPLPSPLGLQAGYQHIIDPKSATTEESWQATWTKSGNYLTLTMLGGEQTEVIRAKGYGPSLARQPMIIARRQTDATEFVAVLEEHTGAPAVRDVKLVEKAGTKSLIIDRMASPKGSGGEERPVQDCLIWSVGDQASALPVGGLRYQGQMAFFKGLEPEVPGKVEAMLLAAGTLVAVGGLTLTSDMAADLALERLDAAVDANVEMLAVSQSNAALYKTAATLTVELPEQAGEGEQATSSWQLWKLTAAGFETEAGLTVTSTAGHRQLSFKAEPGVVYILSTTVPDENTRKRLVVDFRL